MRSSSGCVESEPEPEYGTPGSCSDLADCGETEDGFYTITVDGTELEVYCDMTSDGGGWTLLVTSESQGGTCDDDTVPAAAERGLSKYHERATTRSCSMRTQ